MNRALFIPFLFLSLLFLQVFVGNTVLLFGYINPYIYISFVILYPLRRERYLFLTLSFLLGLCIDFFSDSGGIHAFALLFVAYIRLFFVRIIFKKTEPDYLLFDLKQEPIGNVFNYVMILILIHHFILFSFANFSLKNFSTVAANTLYASLFTAVLFFAGTYIIRNKK